LRKTDYECFGLTLRSDHKSDRGQIRKTENLNEFHNCFSLNFEYDLLQPLCSWILSSFVYTTEDAGSRNLYCKIGYSVYSFFPVCHSCRVNVKRRGLPKTGWIEGIKNILKVGVRSTRCRRTCIGCWGSEIRMWKQSEMVQYLLCLRLDGIDRYCL
jgi:hypothetical protein